MDSKDAAFAWGLLVALVLIIFIFGGEPDVMDILVAKLRIELLGGEG